jgi:hypothetical protein
MSFDINLKTAIVTNATLEWLLSKWTAKIFKFLNQCFARLRCLKSVSNHETYLQLPTAVLLETLFQYWSRAKHWFKLFSTLVCVLRKTMRLFTFMFSFMPFDINLKTVTKWHIGMAFFQYELLVCVFRKTLRFLSSCFFLVF